MSEIENLIAYLAAKNVQVSENTAYKKHRSKRSYEMYEIVNYFKQLSMFHKKVIGYDGQLLRVTGKEIENYKDDIRKLKNIKKTISAKEHLNELDVYFGEQCERYIAKGEKYMSIMYSSGFREILERSLKRREVCIGEKSDIELKNDKILEVSDISECCYDFLEMDAIRLLMKSKKHNSLLELSYAAEKYCNFENLSPCSYEFILAAVCYPYEIIHHMDKYPKVDEDEVLRKKFLNSLKKLIKEDEVNNDGR